MRPEVGASTNSAPPGEMTLILGSSPTPPNVGETEFETADELVPFLRTRGNCVENAMGSPSHITTIRSPPTTPQRIMTLHTSQHLPAHQRRFARVGAVLMAIVVLATACSSSGSGTGADSSTSGTPVDFSYVDFDGSSAQLADLPEGPIVVNFFASWCPTCVAEMPDFQTVSQNMSSEVTFLGLATQDRVENAVQLVADTGVTYTVGNDQNGEIFQIFEGLGMPTTVFINADRTVAKVHTGVLDVESLTDTINDELLS